jgi:hypothetical protein
MAKQKTEKQHYPDSSPHSPGGPGVNPFRGEPTGGTGNVNPSGPSIGTEGWGSGSGEEHTTGTPLNPAGKQPKKTPHSQKAEKSSPDRHRR